MAFGIGSAFKKFGKKVEKQVKRTEPEDVLTAAGIVNPALLVSNLQTVTSGLTAYTQYEAGKQAKEASERAAEAEAATTAEEVRRMTEEKKRTEALGRARAAASGVSGASTELYLDALEKSGREEIDWLKKVGATAYQARLDEGESAYLQAQSQMWGSIGSMIPGVGQAISMFTGI